MTESLRTPLECALVGMGKAEDALHYAEVSRRHSRVETQASLG